MSQISPPRGAWKGDNMYKHGAPRVVGMGAGGVTVSGGNVLERPGRGAAGEDSP